MPARREPVRDNEICTNPILKMRRLIFITIIVRKIINLVHCLISPTLGCDLLIKCFFFHFVSVSLLQLNYIVLHEVFFVAAYRMAIDLLFDQLYKNAFVITRFCVCSFITNVSKDSFGNSECFMESRTRTRN